MRHVKTRLERLESAVAAKQPPTKVIWFDVEDDDLAGLEKQAEERGHHLTVTGPVGDWGRVAMLFGPDVDRKIEIIYGE